MQIQQMRRNQYLLRTTEKKPILVPTEKGFMTNTRDLYIMGINSALKHIHGYRASIPMQYGEFLSDETVPKR